MGGATRAMFPSDDDIGPKSQGRHVVRLPIESSQKWKVHIGFSVIILKNKAEATQR